MKLKTIRFSTLLKKHGPVQPARKMSQQDWSLAVAQGRFATVYHGPSDWCTPVVAFVGRHGCVNTICKIAWTKPLPPDVKEIVGMRNSDEALRLCAD